MGFAIASAQRELGWNRRTIRKGMRELISGMTCVDNYDARGRKRIEEHLPQLLEDIKSLTLCLFDDLEREGSCSEASNYYL